MINWPVLITILYIWSVANFVVPELEKMVRSVRP